MTTELVAQIARVSELHGRATEIASRIREDARLIADVQRELSVSLQRLWQLHDEAKPPVVSQAAKPRMLRLAEVLKRVGLGRSSVWRMVKENRFPAPRRLSTKAIGWLDDEIDDWLKARTSSAGSAEPKRRLRVR
jgi:prophage regulatory protein